MKSIQRLIYSGFAAVAIVRNVPETITELGWDIRKPGPDGAAGPRGSHCGAGAPRWNIETDAGTYFIGCNSPPATTQIAGTGYTRLRWNAATPVFGPTTTTLGALDVERLSIVFDEGYDTGPDNFGLAILDNIGQGNPRANEAIVFNTLRKMLLAYFYRQAYTDASLVVLPQERWEDWRKVNERISIEAAVLPVEKFIAEVPDPSEGELLKFYNEHKDVDPNRFYAIGGRELPAPEPGFAEPRRVRLQYLLGSLARAPR